MEADLSNPPRVCTLGGFSGEKAKNFQRADEIRDTLQAQGIEIIDTPKGVNGNGFK